MQIQIVAADPKGNKVLAISEHKPGQAAVRYSVQSGQKVSLVVDGVTQTGSQTVANQKVKLTRSGPNLIVETLDGSEKLVEFANFYEEKGVVLLGGEWSLAGGSQLVQLAEGVAFSADVSSAASIGLASMASVAATPAIGVGPVAAAATATAVVAAAAASNQSTTETKTLGAPSVAVPEAAGGGINAAEAADGVPVVVTLPAGAAVGDVITVSIDGGTPVTHTVQAADVTAGTVSVLLPASAIAAAGEGAATITTSYADAAGHPATGTPLTTNLTIDTQAPTTPTVDALSTNDTTPVITGTATLLAGESLTVVVNGATYNNVTVDGTGHWSIDTATAQVGSGTLGAFANGQSYSVLATVTDTAGNSASDTSSNEIHINTQAPTTPTVDALSTNDTTPVITGTATLLAGESLTVVVNGATYNNVTVDGTGHWSIDTATAQVNSGTLGAFANGQSYSVLATVTDTAGNSASDTSSNEIHIDTQVPTTPTVEALSTNDITPVITGTATLLAGESLTVTVNGATYNNVTVDGTGHWSIDTNTAVPASGTLGAFANGQSYEVVATAKDAANNTASDTSSNEIHIDTQPPGTPTIALHQDTANTSDFVTSNGQIDVTNLEVGATWQYSLDGGLHWQDGNNGALATGTTDSFVVTPGSYPSGSILVHQKDTAGNTSDDVTLQHPTGYHTTAHQLDGVEGLGDYAPQITALSDGGYVVTWQGGGAAGSTRDIFVQRYDSNDVAIGTAPHQLDGVGDFDFPQITALSDGGYVVTWQGCSADGLTSDIFVQRYDSNNQAIGTAQQLDGMVGGSYAPQISALPEGGYVITWQEQAASSDPARILVQYYNSTGDLVSTTQPSVDYSAAPQISALGNSNYVVTWQGPGAGGLASDVYAQKFSIFGDHNPPHQLDGLGDFDSPPQVTALKDGGYVVTWQARNADGSTVDIFVQRYNANDVAIGTAHQLDGLGGFDSPPQITALSDGGYVVTWQGRSADYLTSDVFVQRYGKDDYPIGTAHKLDRMGGGDNDTPQITALSDDGYVVTWQGYSADYSTSDVFVQRYDYSNQPVDAAHKLDGMGGGDSTPQITALSDGGYVVTWQGHSADGSTVDVFVQRFDDQGNYYSGAELLPLVVDNDPPTTPTVDALSTNDITPVITGTATLLAGESLTVTVNGATYNNVPVTAGHWSIDTATAQVNSGTLGAFANGQSYSVGATVTDTAGNSASDTSSNEIHIDTQPPGTPSLALAHDLGGSSTDLLTSDGTINVTGLEVGATWQYSLDGGTHWQPGNGGAAATATTGSFEASEGSYGAGSVLVKQTDAAGNTSVNGELVSTTTVAQSPMHDITHGSLDRPSKITGLTDGGYVVIWQARVDDGTEQVFTQRYDQTNRAIGAIRELHLGAEENCDITATAGGGYVLAWQVSNGADTDIQLQYFDETNAAGPLILINGAQNEVLPQIAALDNEGSFTGVAVVYGSNGQQYLAAYDANGQQVLSPVQIFDKEIVLNHLSSVTALANGGYVAVGVSEPHSTATYAHLAQYDSNHTLVKEFDFPMPGNEMFITAMPDGGYVAINSYDVLTSGSHSISMQRFNASGDPASAMQTIDASGQMINSTVLTNGNYAVSWTADAAGSDNDVFVKLFNGGTNQLISQTQLHAEAGSSTNDAWGGPHLAALSGGGYVVSWGANTQSYGFEAVFQQYDSAGVANGSVRHLPEFGSQYAMYPDVTALSDDGFVISYWLMDPNNPRNQDIMIQRFDADGHLVPETLALTVDNTPPIWQDSSPAVGSTIGADANIILSFNENMALGSSGHILLKDLSGGTDIDIDLANPAGQLSVVDNTLVINPSADLTVGHSYAVHLGGGAVTDAAGNAFVGFANDTTLNFVAGPPNELHLGTVSGIDLNLIGGFTTSGGQRYYYLDLSNNGNVWDSFTDAVDHDTLDALFNGGADTVDTQPGGAVAGLDDARTAIVGAYTLVLPTAAELATALAQIPNGSNKWSSWDYYWSATQEAANQHTFVDPGGNVYSDIDAIPSVVAVQVLS